MKKHFTDLAILLMFITGCGGSGAGRRPELVGTWNATEMEMTSTIDATRSIEMISIGCTFELILMADSTFEAVETIPGEEIEAFGGTWEASKDVITVRRSDRTGEMQFEYSLSGDTLTMTGADTDFDLDEDGTDEPVKLDFVLARQ